MAALGITILLMGCIISLANSSIETTEYQAGYNAGYTENNKSKYEAACVLSDPLVPSCTEEQLRYAMGYKNGYKDFQFDDLKKQDADKLNNSLEILGI